MWHISVQLCLTYFEFLMYLFSLVMALTFTVLACCHKVSEAHMFGMRLVNRCKTFSLSLFPQESQHQHGLGAGSTHGSAESVLQSVLPFRKRW